MPRPPSRRSARRQPTCWPSGRAGSWSRRRAQRPLPSCPWWRDTLPRMAGPATRNPPPSRADRGRSREELRRRREARRRQLRRRRLTLVGAVLGALALVIVLIVALTGGSASSRRQRSSGLASGGRKPHTSTSAEYRRESRAITRVLSYTPFVSRGSPRKREIALTIDDGPGPLTPQFVHTLQRLHAPATFFVVGQQLNSFGRGLRDAVRAGFPIGDHTEQPQNLPALP